MRNHHFKSPYNSDYCSTTTSNNQVIYDSCTEHEFSSGKVLLTTNVLHSFTQCTFTEIHSTEDGGAISFSNSGSGILTISSCMFDHCSGVASGGNEYGGGAIYTNQISETTVEVSTFLYCSCHSDNGLTEGDGGAITINGSITQHLISECEFIFCSAEDDGGAVAIWNSHANENNPVCKDCIFIACTIPNDDTLEQKPVAGGLILWANTNIQKCSNTLFSSNEGTYGGAYANNEQIQFPNYVLSFCFFSRNTGTYGNDIYLPNLPSGSPLLHCFTTTTENRIGYKDGSFYVVLHPNWLPQDINVLIQSSLRITSFIWCRC